MEDADITRGMNPPGAPPTPPDGVPPSVPPPAANTSPNPALPPSPSPSSPDTTQALSPPTPPPTSVDDLLKERRKQLEAELAQRGATPEEIQRMLATGAPPTLPGTASGAKALRPDIASLQNLMAERMAEKAAERVKAIEQIALGLPEFRESTPQEVRQAEPLMREASMLRRREKYRDAEAKCREAIQLVPKDAAALELLGDLLQGVARVDEALAAYKRATEADPKRASAERKYGDLLMRQQNWGGVDMEMVPKNAYAAVLLSLCLPGAGQAHNGQWGKGIFFFLGGLIFAFLIFWSPWGLRSGHKGHGVTTSMIAIFILAGAFYIVALIDAHLVAKYGEKRGGSSGWDV